MRRGSYAVEFALIAPILLVFLAGVVDWGLYFPRIYRVQQATRACARTGAATDADDDPVGAAEAEAATALTAEGFDATEADISASLAGFSPNITLTCDVGLPYTPIFGLFATAGDATARTTMRLEDQ